MAARFHYEGDEEKNDAIIMRCYKGTFHSGWLSHDNELFTMQVSGLDCQDVIDGWGGRDRLDGLDGLDGRMDEKTHQVMDRWPA